MWWARSSGHTPPAQQLAHRLQVFIPASLPGSALLQLVHDAAYVQAGCCCRGKAGTTSAGALALQGRTHLPLGHTVTDLGAARQAPAVRPTGFGLLPSAPLTLHRLQSFLGGTLDEARLRRIGFGEVTSTQLLIDRTLAEVAGGRGRDALTRAMVGLGYVDDLGWILDTVPGAGEDSA